ncbi:uncharacterized protein O3C94_014355 [Discoglossus pictus]
MKTLICLLVTLLVEIGFGQDGTMAPQIVKPGNCPKVSPFDLELCSKSCQSDGNCEGNQKCCPTSCDGLQCKVPDDKPGYCPPESSVTACDAQTTCSVDSKCKGSLKCCPSSCGSFYCQVPQGNSVQGHDLFYVKP